MIFNLDRSFLVFLSIYLVNLVFLQAFNAQASYEAKSYYKGSLGIGAELGPTSLAPLNLHSPETVTGITGGFRIFWGITNSIGIEAAIHGTRFKDYQPLYVSATEDGVDGEIIPLSPVNRLQQQQHSIGIIYIFDTYRLIPSASAGVARVRTGALSILHGQTVMDNHLYVTAAIDYQITRFFWVGFLGRINLALSNNAAYDGPRSLQIRFSYVWRIQRLSSLLKSR